MLLHQDVLKLLRVQMLPLKDDGLEGRGVVRTSTQAVILIGFNRLKQLVRHFIETMLMAAMTITSSPHRLTSPLPQLAAAQAGSDEN